MVSPIKAFLKYADMCDIRYCLSGALVRHRRVDSHGNIVELKYPTKVASGGRYKRVSFRLFGKKYDVYEHRAIVALLFGEEVLSSAECIDHINGDSHDNRVENLELVSAKENYRRAHEEQFLLDYGEDNHASVISEDEVLLLRTEFMNTPYTMTARDLYSKYGISYSTYCRIVSMKIRARDGLPEGYIRFHDTLTEVVKSSKSSKKYWYKKVGRHKVKSEFYEEVLRKIR